MKKRPAAKSVSVRNQGPPLSSEKRDFAIVGIGASAGGLEAFTQLLQHLPVDTGMAFVLVQHLDPDHESALTSLLARTTRMPVREVTNNLLVEPNHVYVIPPNAGMVLKDGTLKLLPRKLPHGAYRSIDVFLESLAQERHDQAIGVILSGTASDGTLGLEAIKAENGITFAQDESAKYDSMPRNAIAAGCVDFVLCPEKIAGELARMANHPCLNGTRSPSPAAPPIAPAEELEGAFSQESAHKKILLLLRNHSGVDFSLYKPTTIERRITRRMVLNRSESLEGYARFLRGNPKELDLLYSDLLINVTSFFRNPEAFEILKRKVFPKLLPQRREEPVRMWVLGCSTGQEAYSLAMAWMEFSENIARASKLQIFATDLNETMLTKARHGLYPKSLLQDVSAERLRRFFVEEEGGYCVTKSLRDLCVFARQNVLTDPPFSRMNLVSCRNLLIYIQPELQQKIMPAFHYALKPDGFLFLGASESIGAYTDLFEVVDKKHKIFMRKPGPTPGLHLPVSRGQPAERKEKKHTPLPPAPLPELSAQREADRLALARFAPPGVLVNANLQVLQFRGSTDPFLKPPSGKASFDLLKMARQDLLLPLRVVLNKAKKQNQVVHSDSLRVDTRTVKLEVIPLKNLKERCYLIFFVETLEPKPGQRLPSAPPLQKAESKDESRRNTALVRELAETRDYLLSIQDQYEAANEELQASNEEVTSANEELQSINEELETSKEELESTNEELTTVNEEMTNRNQELNRLNSDLNNLHASINAPILLLGRDLTIRRFTAPAEIVFNLLATDVGRPFGGIKHNLDFPNLEQFITEVIDTVSIREREVKDKEGHWYVLRARPYLTLDKKIDGAVLMLVDINVLKQHEQEITAARNFAHDIIDSVPPLLILDADLRVQTANASFYKAFSVNPAETEHRLIYELGNGQWNIPALRKLLEELLPQKKWIHDYQVSHDFETIGQRTMLLNARQIDSAQSIIISFTDITERKRADDALSKARAELERYSKELEKRVAERTVNLQSTVESLETVCYNIAHDLRAPNRTMLGFSEMLLAQYTSALDAQGQNLLQRINQAAERSDRLILDLLAFARLGHIPVPCSPQSLQTTLDSVLEQMAGEIDKKKAKIDVKRPLPGVLANATFLQQILHNLLSNALKFVRPGVAPEVLIWAEERERRAEQAKQTPERQKMIRLSVKDNGIGIAQPFHQKVFGVFEKLHDPDVYPGTGMGLAIVEKGIQRMGGRAGVDSQPGEGSCFWFELPKAESNP